MKLFILAAALSAALSAPAYAGMANPPVVPPRGTEGPDVRSRIEPRGVEGADVRAMIESRGTEGPDVRVRDDAR
jgi:hypothetical protein